MVARLKIHPCFILFAVVLTACGNGLLFFNYLAAVLLHEAGHAYSMHSRGYRSDSLLLMPYGATLRTGSEMLKADDIVVSIAGPLSNLIAAAVISAGWWFFPTTYAYTREMCVANLAIALFNMLPLYPLDAARILLAVTGQSKITLFALRVLGITAGTALIVLWIISMFYTSNHTLAAVGIMLIVGAFCGINKEKDYMTVKRIGLIKDYKNGVEKKTVILDGDVPIKKLMRMLSQDTYLIFSVCLNDGRTTFDLSETDLLSYAAHLGADCPLRKCEGLGKRNVRES